MTEQDQNIAIAEWMGWTNVTMVGGYMHHGPLPFGIKPNGLRYELPSYTTDLNAMHEAEKKLPETLNHIYYSELERACIGESMYNCESYAAHATATQRAEALLRTIGKWKD